MEKVMKDKNKTFFDRLENIKLLPLYTAHDLKLLTRLEHILVESGILFIEVTFRSELALESIKQLSTSGKLIVGAGTVRTLKEAEEAVQHGAQFIVCPSFIPEVVNYCQEQQIPILPGTVTPTEIQYAKEAGLNVIKFFPADVYGGINAINALSGPYYDMKFVPTGGINQKNLPEYVSHKNILAAGGSFIISEKMLEEKDDEELIKHLTELLNVVKESTK